MRRTWVVKIGSSLLTASDSGLHIDRINQWASDIAFAKSKNIDVILVSSGAIAEGMVRMGMKVRPKLVSELQACAAIGQMKLMQAYEEAFDKFDIVTAQVLLTHEDMVHRERYLNAKGTLGALLKMGVMPIVNENDTVVIDETRFGDNDTLGALVANIVSAEKLILLTDQDGLYNKNPVLHDDAYLIENDASSNPGLLSMAQGPGSVFGSGGMQTKVLAAIKAERSGTDTIIANGQYADTLSKMIKGEKVGTCLESNKNIMPARKRWLAAQLKPKGTLMLDDGAVKKIRKDGKSLLPVGVVSVVGDFQRGDMVSCINLENKKIGSGLINYSSGDCEKIIGLTSKEIELKLGYCYESEIIHRDNLIFE